MRLAIGTTAALWMLGVCVAAGQAPADRSPNSEDVFKNVQLLKGIPVDQFMGTMGFFSSSTGLNCTDCHSYDSGGDWAKYADDTPLKRTARRMITMMQAINEANFGGRQMVTCNTCHRGVQNPNVMPSINALYGSPPPEEPGDPITQAQGQPTAESIIDKFIAAVGGAQKVAAFTSFTGTGTYRGYDDSEESPMEMAATATGQMATVAHAASGMITIASDGRTGWLAYPPTDRPFPLIAITAEPTSALAGAADIPLILPKAEEACPNRQAPTTSTTMQLACDEFNMFLRISFMQGIFFAVECNNGEPFTDTADEE